MQADRQGSTYQPWVHRREYDARMSPRTLSPEPKLQGSFFLRPRATQMQNERIGYCHSIMYLAKNGPRMSTPVDRAGVVSVTLQ